MSTIDTTTEIATSFLFISEEEQELAKSAIEQLVQHGNDTTVSLPTAVMDFLLDTLRMAADGQVITGISSKTELTVQQATELLCVSEPFLLKKLDFGEIPFRFDGNERRILMKDILIYKEAQKSLRLRTLGELVAESQEAGLY